jgi:mRNA degradation ribonuclease J1/J2
MVGFAWKDLDRYETVRDAALECGRTPVDPRLAYLLARLGRDIYDERAKVFLERCDSLLYSKGDYVKDKHKIGLMPCDEWDSKTKTCSTEHFDNGLSAVEIRKNPEQYVVQLDYFRFKNILDFDPPRGSVYIRAQCEPFNKRMELSEEKLIHWLQHFKINEGNNNKPLPIHASGHASGPEIQEFVERVKPKILIPIPTTKPGLFKNDSGRVVVLERNEPFHN